MCFYTGDKESHRKMSLKYGSKSFGRRTGFDRRAVADPDYADGEQRADIDRRRILDRRKHKRFHAKEPTYVKLLAASQEDVGQLLDISKGGLSLRYFVKEEKPQDYSDLGLFSSGGNLIIDEVPFRKIVDTELVNNIPFSTITFRRYGVQFENLTPDQTAKLDYFLKPYFRRGLIADVMIGQQLNRKRQG